jgi:glycosyltransferase involved in cell wall biosynthesis
MRIGLSTSVIQRGKSGVGQYVLALTRALAEYAGQHDFTLFVLEEDLPLFRFARNAMRVVSVAERWRPPVRNILWHQIVLPELARRHQLEVLHVPSYRRLLWRRPCALVATIHDLAPFRVAKKYDWKRMLYGRLVVQRLARRQDEIITVSECTAADLISNTGLTRQRITVIHNGVDHDRFFPRPAEKAKAEVALRHGLRAPFFLYVARLEHPAKNHVRLIAAFDQFRVETQLRWHLVLGGSDWHGAEAIHEAIRNSPFAADIHSLGFVPDQDLPALYQAAELFVYPSLYEGFGIPPLEAMACGCPVICSDRGALREVVGHAAAIIDPENVLDLTEQMVRLAGDGEVRECWRVAGLARAKRYHWSKTAAETLEIYSRAATRERTPQRNFVFAPQSN